MSILADSSILKAVDDGKIKITPFDIKKVSSNSYDVSLAKTLIVYTEGLLDCKKDNPYKEVEIPEEGIVLIPGELYLGCTVEKFETEDYIIMFEGKSSLARLGLFSHISAGFGDYGFIGHLTLEFSCVKPIRIYKNMPVGQVYYETMEGMCINKYGKNVTSKYQNNEQKPVPSRMHLNFKDVLHRQRFIDSGVAGIEDVQD